MNDGQGHRGDPIEHKDFYSSRADYSKYDVQIHVAQRCFRQGLIVLHVNIISFLEMWILWYTL
jgi:hypothetical protein